MIIVIIGSIYATVKFTVNDFNNGRFGRICNHQPPCKFFTSCTSAESEQTSVVASPDYKTKSSPNTVHEYIELIERPRSRSFSGNFSNRRPSRNRLFQETSLQATIENPTDPGGRDKNSNCTYNNIIIARTKNLKPRLVFTSS